MVATAQRFVQRHFHTLLMTLVGAGFILILLELIGYNHYKGLQIIAVITTIIGAIAAFAGIRATGRLRMGLAGVLLVLALAGLLGTWEHNEKRLGGGGEGQRPAPAAITGGQRPEGRGFEMPAPPLAPLSLSGFCILGAVALLGRKDVRPVDEPADPTGTQREGTRFA